MSNPLQETQRLMWPRVLLVEDDPSHAAQIQSGMCRHFASCEVVVADQGWQVAQVDLAQFDAVLLNIDLPDCTGLDVLGLIMSRRDMPVLMVTSKCDGELVATAIRSGAIDYVVKQGGYLTVLPVLVEKALVVAELKQQYGKLKTELERRNEQLRYANEQLAATNELLRQMADHDPLTGLTNRRRFKQVLRRRCAEARRQGHTLACMMIDVDYFKRINDAVGHEVGDRVLIALANVLRDELRAADEPARYGGDEFCVLMPHTGALEACTLARRIIQQFADKITALVPDTLRCSLSIGVHAMSGRDLVEDRSLLKAADVALLQAKQNGKGRVVMAAELTPSSLGSA